ncbi:MAG: SPOR domain-containing protein [Chryseolinea sp.]
MQLPRISFGVILITLVLGSCATQKSTTTSTQGGKYSEDLSIWRPKVEAVDNSATAVTSSERKQTAYVEPKYAVNKQIDVVLDSMDRYNLSRNYIEGFTIQIYVGSKKEDALSAKKQLTTLLPDMDSEVQYLQPNFRVKVGKYFNRLEAQQDYSEVKRYFSSAIIVPDKLLIDK